MAVAGVVLNSFTGLALGIGGIPMATVRVVVNFRVKPGKEAELLEGLKSVKQHHQRLGAGFMVVRQAFGPETGNIVAVGQYADWAGFAKLHSDPEFAQLLQGWRGNASLPWDSVVASVNEEIAL